MLLDVPTMQRWEVLRRSERPMTAAEFATACRTSLDVVQASLDRLGDAGFVVRVRASKSMRSTSYRSASPRVVIGLDHETDEAILRTQEYMWEYREARARHRQRLLDRVRSRTDLPIRLRSAEATLTPTLTREESREALEILTNATRALYAIENRARERADREDAGEGAVSFCIFLQMQPLDQHELPMPQYELWASSKLKERVGKVATEPDAALRPKDREIARLLAAGKSRPQIAAQLGVNPHTLASASKRIYAKLGVRTRAELAARMRGV